MQGKLVSLAVSGLVLGLFTLGAKIRLSRFLKRGSVPFRFAALILPIGFLIGEMMIRSVPLRAWIGVLVLTASQAVSGRAGRLLLLIAGLVLFASWSIHSQPWWLQSFFVLSAVFLAPAAVAFEKRHTPLILTLFLLLTVSAIFTIVPDTEDPVLFFGFLLGIAIAASLVDFRTVDHFGSVPLIGILAWVICVGGQGRPASVIVSAGCLGLLVVEPLMRLVMRLTNRTADKTGLIIGFVLHCLSFSIAVGYARTTPSIHRAAMITTAALVIPLLVLAAWEYSRSFHSQSNGL